MGIFLSILFTAVSSVPRISQKRHSINVCWMIVEPVQQDDLLILTASQEKQVVAVLIHFTGRETLGHDRSRCADNTPPASVHHRKQVVFHSGLWYLAICVRVYRMGQSICKEYSRRSGVGRQKTHALQREVPCVVWDEMNHFILLLTSSLNKCSNGQWPVAKAELPDTVPSTEPKKLREMSFNA